MAPLSSRLARLSIASEGRPRRQNTRSGRRTRDGRVTSPVSGANTSASGARTPVSGLRSSGPGAVPHASGASTPLDEDSELESDFSEGDEEEDEWRPFRFFDLPFELRRKILIQVMRYDSVVDINVNAVRRVGMMPVSRQFYRESREAFYGGNIFRLLPLDGPVHKKRTKPLIQLFSARNRALITRLELRLGPHWKDPPRSWQIDEKMGLEDLQSLRRLDVFVQCDPEHPTFAGFRRSKEFYTHFCGELLSEIIRRAPKLETISIDSYPAVGRDSPLIRRLESEAFSGGKAILWSAILRLDDCYDKLLQPGGTSVYDTVVIRELIMAE